MQHAGYLGARPLAAKAKEGPAPSRGGPWMLARDQNRRVTPTETIRDEWIGLTSPPAAFVA